MSKLVAFAAVQGAYNIVSQVEGEYKRALETFSAATKVGFPNTPYLARPAQERPSWGRP